jgi:hypothetical protein
MRSGLEQLRRNAPAERRAKARYPVTRELRYTTSRRYPPIKIGTGRTIDLSSSGLKFIADRTLMAGQVIEVYIDWPPLRSMEASGWNWLFGAKSSELMEQKSRCRS